jgi:hypothetical protein
MNKNNEKLKEMLYKQKKLLLMLGLSAVTTSSLASCKSNNVESNNTAIEKDIEQDSTTTLYSGVSSVISSCLEEKDNSLTAGVATKLTDIAKDFDKDNITILNTETDKEKSENPSYNEEDTEIVEDTTTLEPEEEKTYYDFACSNEFQDYIISISDAYGIPYEIMFTIIERESGGEWNTNGVISKTNDYGLCQINKCNLSDIYDVLGYTEDEILNDPYKNVEAALYLLQTIFNHYGYTKDNFEYENVFGCYNGWVRWKKIKGSVNYSNGCMKILEEKFGDLEQNTSRGI